MDISSFSDSKSETNLTVSPKSLLFLPTSSSNAISHNNLNAWGLSPRWETSKLMSKFVKCLVNFVYLRNLRSASKSSLKVEKCLTKCKKMCGGFTCSKNTLIALNILYFIVSFVLIGVAAYGLAASFITSLRIVVGIIVCGAFLFFLSLLGLIGAIRHNQVLLFFYMIILFLLFVVQFGIACACLAFNEQQQHELVYEGWHRASMGLRDETQIYFNCCEFENSMLLQNDSMKGPNCTSVLCCQGYRFDQCTNMCPTCWKILQNVIGNALKISGGIGLFFSFTEIVSVWVAFRYRQQRDPKINPRLLFL